MSIHARGFDWPSLRRLCSLQEPSFSCRAPLHGILGSEATVNLKRSRAQKRRSEKCNFCLSSSSTRAELTAVYSDHKRMCGASTIFCIRIFCKTKTKAKMEGDKGIIQKVQPLPTGSPLIKEHGSPKRDEERCRKRESPLKGRRPSKRSMQGAHLTQPQ